MNKIILAALITTVSAISFAAYANEPVKSEPAAVPAAEAPATTDAKPVAGELKDGTKIEITGDKVEVVGKDGKKTAAPDGEHTLKDGSKVTTKGGMIVKK
jgi:uncharacterized protein YdeI (BOF family)